VSHLRTSNIKLGNIRHLFSWNRYPTNKGYNCFDTILYQKTIKKSKHILHANAKFNDKEYLMIFTETSQ
jgi:hypothetical protein